MNCSDNHLASLFPRRHFLIALSLSSVFDGTSRTN